MTLPLRLRESLQMVFFELSVPFEQGKQKGKQVAGITPSERLSIEARIDALVLRWCNFIERT